VNDDAIVDYWFNFFFPALFLHLSVLVMFRCVLARSSATVKLELLPLTDGIITLDTLQITIKEKGVNTS
jgi:hypothetical protein